MSIPPRINIVTLGVADLPRACAFYDALGWERSSASMDEIVWYKLAGAVLGLFSYEALAADAQVEASPRGAYNGITLAINLESKNAVDGALTTAVAAGGTIVKPATEMDWGGYSAYFADLDGYLWEVAWNPFFPIGANGLLEMP